MDVLHIAHQFAPETRGGVESYLMDVARAQRARGQQVELIVGSHQPWDRVGSETLDVEGLTVHQLHRDDLFFDLYSKMWHPGVGDFLRAFLRERRPRLVHVHQWIRLTSNLVEIIRSAGIPVVATLHDFYASCPRAFRMRPGHVACTRPVGTASCLDCVPRYGHETEAEVAEGIELFADQFRAELLAAQALLVGVASTAELIAAATGLPRDRFTVLPLGYRRRFPGLPPLSGPPGGKPFRFAFWGGVAPHKGIAVLLEAAAMLTAEGRGASFELHVLGGFATPGFEVELRHVAEGLPVRVHGPFQTSALREVAPDAGVFPSTCLETFGIVLDECFELGLPCIVADHGALTARAGKGGLRARPGDAADLARCMARLLDESDLWPTLHAALPALSPSIDEHCDALAAIYRAAGEAARVAPAADPDLARRRTAFLFRQRESALSRLPPPE